MKKVSHLNEFPKDCYVALFMGKEYSDAVKSAEKMLITPISYFEQRKIGKSNTILVAYKKKENENELP